MDVCWDDDKYNKEEKQKEATKKLSQKKKTFYLLFPN